MSQPHFLIHEEGDVVGVVVVEDVQVGDELTGLNLHTQSQITIKSLDAIPLGHKIALVDLQSGDTVIKYGEDMGKVVQPMAKGNHAHVHNIKTKRW